MQAGASKLDTEAAAMTMDKLVVMTANVIEYFKLQGIIGIGGWCRRLGFGCLCCSIPPGAGFLFLLDCPACISLLPW